jgi:hypothetical protein
MNLRRAIYLKMGLREWWNWPMKFLINLNRYIFILLKEVVSKDSLFFYYPSLQVPRPVWRGMKLHHNGS